MSVPVQTHEYSTYIYPRAAMIIKPIYVPKNIYQRHPSNKNIVRNTEPHSWISEVKNYTEIIIIKSP